MSKTCFADPEYDELLLKWLTGVYFLIASDMKEDEKLRALSIARETANPAYVFKPEVVNEVCRRVEFADAAGENRTDAKESFELLVKLLAKPFLTKSASREGIEEEEGRYNQLVDEKLSVLAAATTRGERNEAHLVWSCGAQ